eukprot:g25152.t1
MGMGFCSTIRSKICAILRSLVQQEKPVERTCQELCKVLGNYFILKLLLMDCFHFNKRLAASKDDNAEVHQAMETQQSAVSAIEYRQHGKTGHKESTCWAQEAQCHR